MFMNACWSDAAVGGTVLALALFMMFISESVFNSPIITGSVRAVSRLESLTVNYDILIGKFQLSFYCQETHTI